MLSFLGELAALLLALGVVFFLACSSGLGVIYATGSEDAGLWTSGAVLLACELAFLWYVGHDHTRRDPEGE